MAEIEEDLNSFQINKKITIQSYAPETFEKMRIDNNVTDEDLINSLEPSKNI